MIDWQALALESVRYRDSKNFLPTDWDTAPIRISCLHSEIIELEDALAAAEPWPIRYELADIVSYSVAMIHDLSGGNANWSLRQSFHGGSRRHATPAELTAPLRKCAKAAFEAWRRLQTRDVVISLELLIVATVDLRQRVLCLPGEIDADVRAKLHSMSGRPESHGKDRRS